MLSVQQPYAWLIQKNYNKACFDGKLLYNAVEIVCHTYALMRFWVGLNAKGCIYGVNATLNIAFKLLAKLSQRMKDIKLIQDADQDRGDDQEASK